jgi:hypothetical protein
MGVWATLIVVCWLVGTAILNGVQADCFERMGDRFVIAVWLGVIILSVSLLTASLVLPLSPLVGAVVASSMTVIALRSHPTRTEIRALRSLLSPQWIFGLISLEFVIATSATQAITFFDTGLYHFQAIQWLSRFGVVPGLALIHNRFGFTSSWFALAAPFNAGIFEARIAAITGGFAFLLAAVHLLICLTRIWQNWGLFEDWFIVSFSLLCLPVITFTGMPVSPSPDLPFIILTGVIAWIHILFQKRRKIDTNFVIDARIIPLILSAGVVTIKLSAIPLLLISIFFYIFGSRFNFKRTILFCAISFLLILPMLGFGIITSGCPLYPSSLMCLDLPWSLGAKNAKEMSKIIQDWARWSGAPPLYANSWNWLGHWIKYEQPTVLLIICSVLSTLAIFKLSKSYQINRSKNYIFALGVLGISFVMYSAPSLRFGLGYFCLIPAFFIVTYSEIASPFGTIALGIILGTLTHFLWLGLSKTGLLMVGLTIIVCLGAWFYSRKIYPKIYLMLPLLLLGIISLKGVLVNNKSQASLILPPKLRSPHPTQLLNRQTNDIKYVVSTVTVGEGQCWAAELPCTPTLINEAIKLRRPEGGIGEGFIRN